MQQVNLYTTEFQPRKVRLPLEHILGLAVVTLIVLTLLSMLLESNLNDKQAQLNDAQAQAAKMRERVTALEARAATLIKDESLVLANDRLSQQLAAREQMLEVLDTVVVKDDAGFSNLLIALARQRISSLWLTRISLGAGGKSMTLEGSTTHAEAVPEYLQNLRQEASFLGRTFALFALESNEEKKAQLDFRLHSLSNAGSDGLLVSTQLPAGNEENTAGGLQP